MHVENAWQILICYIVWTVIEFLVVLKNCTLQTKNWIIFYQISNFLIIKVFINHSSIYQTTYITWKLDVLWALSSTNPTKVSGIRSFGAELITGMHLKTCICKWSIVKTMFSKLASILRVYKPYSTRGWGGVLNINWSVSIIYLI